MDYSSMAPVGRNRGARAERGPPLVGGWPTPRSLSPVPGTTSNTRLPAPPTPFPTAVFSHFLLTTDATSRTAIARQGPYPRHPRFHPDNRGFVLTESGLGATPLGSFVTFRGWDRPPLGSFAAFAGPGPLHARRSGRDHACNRRCRPQGRSSSRPGPDRRRRPINQSINRIVKELAGDNQPY
jgi:hypothetical protein